MKITLVLGQEIFDHPRAGGGVITLVQSLAEGFSVKGHDVAIVSANPRPVDADERVKYIQVKGVVRSPSNIVNFFRGLPYFWRAVRASPRSDVTSCHNYYSFLFKFFRKFSIVTHTVHRAPKKYMKLYGLCDRVYSGSPSIVEELANISVGLKKNGKCVLNFVDFDGYEFVSSPQLNAVTFLYVGRVVPDKGLASLVRGFHKAVANSAMPLKLRILGPQSSAEGADPLHTQELITLTQTLGIFNLVSFEPPIYDRKLLEESIRKCNVVCLPSLGGETLNMTMIECMRLSKPLIVSSLPANRPLVLEGKSGYFAEMNDPSSWAAIFSKFAKNTSKLDSYSKASFNYGKDTFSKDVIIDAYLDDFASLLK